MFNLISSQVAPTLHTTENLTKKEMGERRQMPTDSHLTQSLALHLLLVNFYEPPHNLWI